MIIFSMILPYISRISSHQIQISYKCDSNCTDTDLFLYDGTIGSTDIR